MPEAVETEESPSMISKSPTPADDGDKREEFRRRIARVRARTPRDIEAEARLAAWVNSRPKAREI
jgi:hypothetical protein